jgi:hypothetical protein
MPNREYLTELQSTVIETYRQKLAENLPDVEILDVCASDGIVEVRLNDVVIRDYSTLNRTTELAVDIEEQFNVTLLPYVTRHEN